MKILFIPYEPRPGTARRIPNLIRILSKRHEVSGLSPVAFKKSLPFLQRPIKMIERIYEPLKFSRMSEESRGADLIFASQNRYALPAAMIAKRLRLPVVFDSHGNPELLSDDIGAGFFFRFRNVFPEKRLAGKIRCLITVSALDRDAYIRMGFDANLIEVVPTCINFEDVRRASRDEARDILGLPPDQPIILFFGSYSYAPNEEAVDFINGGIAPALPQAKIILAGSGSLKGPLRFNVDFRGFVDNLGAYILAADICIAPIWHGVGILEKVLLMMAHGRPTVTTPFAKRGIPELADGKNCFIASDGAEFINRIKMLLDNPAAALGAGEAAGELIRQNYSWPLYEERIFHAIEGL